MNWQKTSSFAVPDEGPSLIRKFTEYMTMYDLFSYCVCNLSCKIVCITAYYFQDL
jgi:hypothetical protein